MKKLLALALFMLVLLFTLNAFAFQNEPDGFRDIKWGTNLNALQDMKVSSKYMDTIYYGRNKDKMSIEGAKLASISYLFCDNSFCEVQAWVLDYENFRVLKKAYFKKFGEPDDKQISSPGDNRYEIYRWGNPERSKTYIFLKFDSGEGFLNISSPALRSKPESNTQDSQIVANSNAVPIVLFETKRAWFASLDGPTFVLQFGILYKGGTDLIWRIRLVDKNMNEAFLDDLVLTNGLEILKQATKKSLEWSAVASKHKTEIDDKVITNFNNGVTVSFSSVDGGKRSFLVMSNPSWITYGAKKIVLPFLVPNKPSSDMFSQYTKSQTMKALLKALDEAKKQFAEAEKERQKKDSLFK